MHTPTVLSKHRNISVFLRHLNTHMNLLTLLFLLTAPLSGWMTERYGCRITTMIGACVASLGLFISWFSRSMIFLCVTYGVLTGVVNQLIN